MVRVTFYFKEGCWLCEQAEELLNSFMERYDIKINKVDISSDEALYELYRFDIPVIEFRDGAVLHGRIRKKELINLLGAHKE